MASEARGRGRRRRKSLGESLRGLLDYDLLWTVVAILIIVAITAPQLRFPEPEYEPGDIAEFDVTAPIDLTVDDPVSTQRRRAEAADGVPDIYDLNPQAYDYAKRVVQSFFGWGRRVREGYEGPWSELAEDVRADLNQQAMAAVDRPLPTSLIEALWDAEAGFSLDNELAVAGSVIGLFQDQLVGSIEPTRVGGTTGILIRDITTQEEQRHDDTSDVLGLSDARNQLRAALAERLELSEEAEETVGDMVAQLVQPNLTYNSNETQLRRQREIAAVEPAFYTVKRGRVLLREGDVVSAQNIVELEALRSQRSGESSLVSTAGTALLVALAVISLWRFVVHYRRRFRYQRVRRLYLLTLVVLVAMVLLTQVSLFIGEAVGDAMTQEPFDSVESYHYAIPFATGAMLVLLLSEVQVAWAFSAVFAVVLGTISQDLGLTLYALLGSFAALYGMSQYKQRTALTQAGLFVGGVNIAAVVAISLMAQPVEPWTIIAFNAACALAGGILVSIAATVALPPLEHSFQSLTDIKLLELSNMNLPLLKELAVAAPGTYHHSVVVGTLAEQAAEAIGVSSLFARVAAYYHDIGKLRQPQYFVENQKDGVNPHDKLSPNMSALVLVSHVKDGVAYAREHGLPEPLVDMIPQHHGTRLIRYFYEKAKQTGNAEVSEPDELDFRYPGPKPQSKEAAILMLADSVEAISRTLSDASPTRLRTMIQSTVQEVVDDAQLDECALTLEDLSNVTDAFLSVLAGMRHQRIEYPSSTDSSEEVSVTFADEDSGSELSDQTYH